MDVKPSWASKINWTQVISMIVMIAAVFGLTLDPEQLTKVLEGVIAANGLVTIVLRTFFTTRLTAASVK